jgi:hypothetical protein
MIKKILFFVLALFLLLPVNKVFAGGFNLKSIGQVDTSGREISHWWYSGSSAVMKGEAAASSTVTVSVDGTDGTATADGDGNWTYSPASLADGDHEVVLTNSGSTIKFTLTTGVSNVNWDAVDKDAGTTTLPTAGVTFPTIALMMVGGSLVLVAKKLAKQN